MNAGLWIALLFSTTLGLMFALLAMRSALAQKERKFARLLKTEKQQTNSQIARLQGFLSAIQASPNGVIVLDKEQRIEWCNQTAADLLGLDAQRDVLQHIMHLVREPQFVEYMAGNDHASEIRFDDKAVQLHPFGDGRALLLVRDITDIERAERMRRDFVANVSHEIKTPLTVLSGFLETIQNLELSADERQKYLQLMQIQSDRMQALVEDLLTLSKLDEQVKPKLERVDMRALLAQCEQEAGLLATTLNHPLSLTFELEDSTDMSNKSDLIGSTSELYSACSNLITNAVRYTPNGGKVQVTWKSRTLTVQDTGQGIAQEHLPRITERFYRVDQSRARAQADRSGTGLGLAIVKHVAQRHGARLEIESELGVGSTFRLVFT